MSDKRLESRTLCADLVTVEWKDRMGWDRQASAVLEDISARGACLQMEYPVPLNINVSVRFESWTAGCRAVYCVFREIGYYVGLEFLEGSRWSRRLFRPRHLLDLSDLDLGALGAADMTIH